MVLHAPRRDPRRLFTLVRARLESVVAPERLAGIALAVRETSPLKGRQVAAFGGPDVDEPLSDLVERLVARLGEGRVLRARLVAEARPERAYALSPETRPPKTPAAPPPRAPFRRPVRLFDPPRPVAAEGLRLVRGPERIATGWWDGERSGRDYHEAEDGSGARRWVFRSDAGWKLHGSFA
jgi:protein ImuB